MSSTTDRTQAEILDSPLIGDEILTAIGSKLYGKLMGLHSYVTIIEDGLYRFISESTPNRIPSTSNRGFFARLPDRVDLVPGVPVAEFRFRRTVRSKYTTGGI